MEAETKSNQNPKASPKHKFAVGDRVKKAGERVESGFDWRRVASTIPGGWYRVDSMRFDKAFQENFVVNHGELFHESELESA